MAGRLRNGFEREGKGRDVVRLRGIGGELIDGANYRAHNPDGGAATSALQRLLQPFVREDGAVDIGALGYAVRSCANWQAPTRWPCRRET